MPTQCTEWKCARCAKVVITKGFSYQNEPEGWTAPFSYNDSHRLTGSGGATLCERCSTGIATLRENHKVTVTKWFKAPEKTPE